MSCQSERTTGSSRKQSRTTSEIIAERKTRAWKSDEDYVSDQDHFSSVSTDFDDWGDAAATKFIAFGEQMLQRGLLFHDDTVADFGGNDGWAAYNFYMALKIKPLVIDCEPKRLERAEKQYLLPTYLSFIEDMKDLADKSIDWGFCSHTLEHTRDPVKAIREIARVVKRRTYFVVPLESKYHAKQNHAHSISLPHIEDWRTLLEENGWNVLENKKVHRFEAHFIVESK